jgi:sugar lactone lactonase YvrE
MVQARGTFYRSISLLWMAGVLHCGGFPSKHYVTEALIAYNLLGGSGSGCVLTGGSTNCPLNISGVVTSLATAGLSQPNGVTCDGTYIYVADSGTHRILKVQISTGAVSLVAGSGAGALVNGTGAAAQFSTPRAITTDGTNLYVADTNNHVIRRIDISSTAVTTLAGSGAGAFADGSGAAAQFNFPAGIASDGTNLYVGDTDNQRVRKVVISSAAVTSLAGSTVGYTDATGNAAQFNFLRGVITDGTNVYVADTGNHRVRKVVISSGVVTTLAGNGTGAFADGTGTAAQFFNLNDGVTDGTNLYIVDSSNGRLRKIVLSTGVVTTLASGLLDPRGVTTDGTSLFVADTNNNRILRVQ